MSQRADHDAAFTDFAAGVTPRLFRAALLLCGDWHLAEDLVQTTLAKLYVKWRRVDKAASPHAYARTALFHTYLAHKRLRRSTEVPAADALDSAAITPDPTNRVLVAEALRVLRPLDRAVVVLRYYEQDSVAETAAALGLSEGAVRTRASRALARLRAELSESREEKS